MWGLKLKKKLCNNTGCMCPHDGIALSRAISLFRYLFYFCRFLPSFIQKHNYLKLLCFNKSNMILVYKTWSLVFLSNEIFKTHWLHFFHKNTNVSAIRYVLFLFNNFNQHRCKGGSVGVAALGPPCEFFFYN